MKTITRIARTELASLFFSPIAWFILVVFSVITGYGFWDLLQSVAGHEYDISVTQLLFMDSGLFSKISSSLYIYIPLLTMGLISSEVSSGSIKLPYSSPITSFEFVAGKYLASITFGLTLLIVPVIAIVYSAAVVPHFDLPAVLTGLFGLWLLICTYCAVGLFMSSLTSYQVVAALYTFIALAAMRYVGSIGQDVDWISEITYWLSLNGRAEYMFAGALRSVEHSILHHNHRRSSWRRQPWRIAMPRALDRRSQTRRHLSGDGGHSRSGGIRNVAPEPFGRVGLHERQTQLDLGHKP